MAKSIGSVALRNVKSIARERSPVVGVDGKPTTIDVDPIDIYISLAQSRAAAAIAKITSSLRTARTAAIVKQNMEDILENQTPNDYTYTKKESGEYISSAKFYDEAKAKSDIDRATLRAYTEAGAILSEISSAEASIDGLLFALKESSFEYLRLDPRDCEIHKSKYLKDVGFIGVDLETFKDLSIEGHLYDKHRNEKLTDYARTGLENAIGVSLERFDTMVNTPTGVNLSKEATEILNKISHTEASLETIQAEAAATFVRPVKKS